ncbi:MAG: hypothetical protein LBJ82_00040 [Deltaproteobacteria bacterium]|jgi:hypothetical protein|nr:hypothetical protein [Deltaproteobacteria bacterium]
MIRFGETLHSCLPQDIPWFLPDHAIFFGAFYAALLVIGGGLGFVTLKSILDLRKDRGHH